jgi:hypothetical protein
VGTSPSPPSSAIASGHSRRVGRMLPLGGLHLQASMGSRTGLWMLMARVKGVVEINTREDGEYVGLEHGDQEVERR